MYLWAMRNHANAKKMRSLPRTARGRKQNGRQYVKLILHWSHWFNKAISSYITYFCLNCLYFFFTSWLWHKEISCITANKKFSMVCLNRAVLGHFFANLLFLYGNLWKLKYFSGSFSDRFEQSRAKKHPSIFAHKTKQTRKAWKRITEPAALQASRRIQVRHDVTHSGLVAEDMFQNGGCRCQILDLFICLGIECTLEAETLVSNLTQYKLCIGGDKTNTLFIVTFSFNSSLLGRFWI